MNSRFHTPGRGFLLLLAIGATLGCYGTGSSQPVTAGTPATAPVAESFDLILYGHDLDPGEHEVFLRSNLDYGAEWVSLGTIEPVAGARGPDGWGAALFPGLSTQRFLGQDFRENYLDVKIVTAGDADGSRVSAFYAMPHSDAASAALPRVTRLIETEPLTVQRLSIASHVQPSPATLRPGTEHVEHVRAPMTDDRPGVAEVLQLEVEWRNRDG